MTDGSSIENMGLTHQLIPEGATELQFYWESVNKNKILWTFFYRPDGADSPKRRVDVVVLHSDVLATEPVPQWLDCTAEIESN